MLHFRMCNISNF